MKKRHNWRWAEYLLICALVLLQLSGCGKSGEEADNNSQPSLQEEQGGNEPETDTGNEGEDMQSGEAGVAFEGQDIEGNAVSSSVFGDSKLTMVNVWATYCNPCLKEMPELGELAKEYEPDQFQLIGIISDVQEGAGDEALEYALGLIEQTGADYPHLLLNESIYRGLLTEVSAVPTTFFVNENGEVLDVVVGAMKKSAWEEKINTLLGK